MTTSVVALDEGRPRSVAGVSLARADRIVPIVVAGLVLAVGLLLVDGLPVGSLHDDAMYVILAKALATGEGYRWIHVPGAPPATHFPPGYPFLLAVVWKLWPAFPQNIVAFKVLNAMLLSGASVGVVVLVRRLGYSPWIAGAVALAGCLAIPTLVLSTVVMSEPLFLALLLPLVLRAERVTAADASTRTVGVLGALAGTIGLVRGLGIALVPAIALTLLLRRRWRDAIVLTLSAAVVIVPWQFWVHAHQGFVPAAMRGNYESYDGWLASGLQRDGLWLVMRTLKRTSAELLAMVLTVCGATLPAAARAGVLVMVGALSLAGLWGLRRSAPVTATFVVLYLVVVLAWPFTPTRFVWGVWPLLVVLPTAGLLVVWGWRPRAGPPLVVRATILAAAMVAAYGYAAYNILGYRDRWWSSIPRHYTMAVWPLVVWTATHTRRNEVVASPIEPMLYLYTGRQTVPVSSFTVDDYFHPSSVAASEVALRDILGAYRVGVIGIIGADSLLAAARRLAALRPPVVVWRDTVPNGNVFAPAGTFQSLVPSR